VTNLEEKEGEKDRSITNSSVADRLKIPILISWTYDPNVITQRKHQEETVITPFLLSRLLESIKIKII
jgi:hypothetical protein